MPGLTLQVLLLMDTPLFSLKGLCCSASTGSVLLGSEVFLCGLQNEEFKKR